MKKTRTHYDNLQVKENASDEVIKGAYRYLSQKWHPDKNHENRPEAERVLKIINEAYAVLSDPAKRREHDDWIVRQDSNDQNNTGEKAYHSEANAHPINTWFLFFGTAMIFLGAWLVFYASHKGAAALPLISGFFLLKDSKLFHGSVLKLRSNQGASSIQYAQSDRLEYAGFWSRVGAGTIDIVFLLLLTVPLSLAVYGRRYFVEQNTSVIAGPADFFINWILPAALTMLFWWYKQATPGKMAISARIVDAKTGSSLTVGQTAGRYLAYFVAILPFCLGLFWIAFDSRKQGWHDKLAGTVVVRKKHVGPDPVRFEERSKP